MSKPVKNWIVYLGKTEKEVSLRFFVLNNHIEYKVFSTDKIEKAIDWIKNNPVEVVITSRLAKRTVESLVDSPKKNALPLHIILCGAPERLQGANNDYPKIYEGKDFARGMFEAIEDALAPKQVKTLTQEVMA